ncbi:MAG TPA: hypothetical protein VJ103_02640 [Candidatus Paceibacterota bacterium]|nr:hypothetical protein [Candidatus Paceibacterota bacterium]
MHINKKQAALTLGSIAAIGHFLWVLALIFGLGQRLLDWSLSYHFISIDKTVTSPTLGLAIIGIVTAFVCGYIVGWVFAWIWNRMGQKA